jgi:hypothetical protein
MAPKKVCPLACQVRPSLPLFISSRLSPISIFQSSTTYYPLLVSKLNHRVLSMTSLAFQQAEIPSCIEQSVLTYTYIAS